MNHFNQMINGDPKNQGEITVSNRYKRYGSLSGIDLASHSVDELKALVRGLLAQKIHGIAFSPYIEGQGPGTIIGAAQIRERLAVIAPYVNWVRSLFLHGRQRVDPPDCHRDGVEDHGRRLAGRQPRAQPT